MKILNEKMIDEKGFDRVPCKHILQLEISSKQKLLLFELFGLVEKPKYKPRISGLNLAKFNSTFTSMKNCKGNSHKIKNDLNELIKLGYILVDSTSEYLINVEKIYIDGQRYLDKIYDKDNEVSQSAYSIKTDVSQSAYSEVSQIDVNGKPISLPKVSQIDVNGKPISLPKVSQIDVNGKPISLPIQIDKQIETNIEKNNIQKCKFFDFDFEISQDEELLKLFNNNLYLNNLNSIISNIEKGRYVNLNYVINKRYPSVDKYKENPINNITKLKELISELNILEYNNSNYMFDIRNKYVQDIYSKVYTSFKKDDKESIFIRDYFQKSLVIISEYIKFNSDDIQANLLYLTIKHQCVNYSIYGNEFNIYLEYQINKFLSNEIEIGSTDNIKKDVITKNPIVSAE